MNEKTKTKITIYPSSTNEPIVVGSESINNQESVVITINENLSVTLDEKASSDLVFAINKAMWDLGWKRKASDQDEDGEKPIGFRRNERRRK